MFLEVFLNDMRYINSRFTHLLPFLKKKRLKVFFMMSAKVSNIYALEGRKAELATTTTTTTNRKSLSCWVIK